MWTNPFAIDADMCVRAGYPSGTIGPNYVLGTPTGGVPITLNAANQPNTGTSYYTFVLSNGSFVWNRLNLVLSFEWFGLAAIGAGTYVNYCESSGSSYNVFGVKVNAGAASFNAIRSGYALSGFNATLMGGADAAITSVVNSPSNYCASNLRPRLMFFAHTSYDLYPIKIGKTLVNNNPYIKTGGSVAGDSGFVAGKSKVTFDPSIRSVVNSQVIVGCKPNLESNCTVAVSFDNYRHLIHHKWQICTWWNRLYCGYFINGVQ